MILQEKTLVELKIDITSLKTGSAKKVWFKCNKCGLERKKQYRDCMSGTGLCQRCFREQQGKKLGSVYGKSQIKEGICFNCGLPCRHNSKNKHDHCNRIECIKAQNEYLSNIRLGSNNPVWTGRSICQCGKRKSLDAKFCRKCSFENGLRSGSNNGRYIKDKREYYLQSKKIKNMISSCMNHVCKKGGFQKNYNKTKDILGYSWLDFKIYFESKFLPGMTWENHGSGEGKWQIDHIIPVDWFIKNNCFNIRIVNALSNLQPLWAIDNLKKSNKL